MSAFTDKLREIAGQLVALAELADGGAAKKPGEAVASDADLDGEWGNPLIRFDPRDWSGESYKGKHYSEASSEFLNMYASTLDYFARKNDEKGDAKKAGYDRRDASRARGWSARNLNGTSKPVLPASQREEDSLQDWEKPDSTDLPY